MANGMHPNPLPCGCGIKGTRVIDPTLDFDYFKDHHIVFCPMHAAVADLREFARDIRDNYDHEECYHRNGMAGMCCRVCKAEAVLAKAEGKS